LSDLKVADLAADPIGIWTTIREAYAEKYEERRPQCPYEPDLGWEQQLSSREASMLGIPLRYLAGTGEAHEVNEG
jgi:hypothetical protein